MSASPALDVTFLDGSAGPVFCVTSLPAVESAPERQSVIFIVPPFAEEMNRSRRFMAGLRNALAEAGHMVLQPDLYGTGDSGGDFQDARWDVWVADISMELEALADAGHTTISLIGIRAGCLLVDDVCRQLSRPLQTIVRLQAEQSGHAVVHAQLRARVAAQRFAGISDETSDALWHRFDNGESVDISGYRLSAALAMAMKSKVLDFDTQWSTSRQIMIKLLAAHEVDTSVNASDDNASRRNSAWQQLQFVGQPFWQLHDAEAEAAVVEKLLEYLGL